MFWLRTVLVLICGGGTGGIYTTIPESTLAVVGDNVTLSCTLSVQACEPSSNPSYVLRWDRHNAGVHPGYISECRMVYEEYQDRYNVDSLDGNNWTLQIRNVQRSDSSRKYRCISLQAGELVGTSPFAMLIVVDPVNTEVHPPLQRKKKGQAASFTCRAHVQVGDSFAWFINTNGIWTDIQNSDNFKLNDNGDTLKIRQLHMQQNGSRIACEVVRESTSLTRQGQTALLIVGPSETVNTAGLTTESLSEKTLPSHGEGNTAESSLTFTAPTIQGVDVTPDGEKPSIQPTSHQFSPTDDHLKSSAKSPNNLPKFEKEDNSNSSGQPSIFVIGGIVAAISLLLVIAFLLYFLLSKSRGKPDTNPNCQSHGTQDKEARSRENGTTETRLGICDDSPTSSQPICLDTESGEPPKSSTTVEEVQDSNQLSSPEQDQGKASKIPIKDVAELNVVLITVEAEKKSQTMGGKSTEVLYAMPDKRFLKTKTIGSTRNSSQKVDLKNSEKPKESKLEPRAESSQGLEDRIQKRPEPEKPTIAVKPFKREAQAPSSDVKPPLVVPFHLSKGRAPSSSTNASESMDKTTEKANGDDPKRKNVENLVYADLDLRGKDRREAEGESIACIEEETLYADIVNKDTLGKLR